MKYFYILLLFLLPVICKGNTYYQYENIKAVTVNVNLIETEYLASVDLRSTPQIEWLAFEVIGFIMSELLPAVFTEICLDLGVNPQICNAGGQAISFLLSLEEGNLHIGQTGEIEWKVSRGKKESFVSFKTKDRLISQRLRQLLLSYSENCAKDLIWKKIVNLDLNNIHINYANDRAFHQIQLQNNIARGLKWAASVDGTQYTFSNLPIDFHEGPGLFGDLYPFRPVEIDFSEKYLPFYFNDGAYVRLAYNGHTQDFFFRYDKRYVLNRNYDGNFQALPYDL
ncbi:MAG: hypothetical protein JSS76_00670 [Bacteroidetes bacterium]|nr:hypothetical protein [Bacteroidota bacterium]